MNDKAKKPVARMRDNKSILREGNDWQGRCSLREGLSGMRAAGIFSKVVAAVVDHRSNLA